MTRRNSNGHRAQPELTLGRVVNQGPCLSPFLFLSSPLPTSHFFGSCSRGGVPSWCSFFSQTFSSGSEVLLVFAAVALVAVPLPAVRPTECELPISGNPIAEWTVAELAAAVAPPRTNTVTTVESTARTPSPPLIPAAAYQPGGSSRNATISK